MSPPCAGFVMAAPLYYLLAIRQVPGRVTRTNPEPIGRRRIRLQAVGAGDVVSGCR
jgi:hypothetical protein